MRVSKKIKKVVSSDESDLPSVIQLIDGVNSVFSGPPSYEIALAGAMISKKNNYSPMANGRGFFKSSKILNVEKMVSLQIPGELRGLKLKNPHMIIECCMPKKSWRSDVDNTATFLLDCLVKAEVLSDDSINHCNGYKLIVPVIETSDYFCRIRMWRNND